MTEVVVCGWGSSGSTLIFRALRYLGVKVEKEHSIHRAMDAFPDSKYIFTYRDPRDVILSSSRRSFTDKFYSDTEECLSESVDCFFRGSSIVEYRKVLTIDGVFMVKYEDFFPNFREKELIESLAEWLTIKLHNNTADVIVQEFGLKKSKVISDKLDDFKEWDRSSYIHGDHITNMGKVGGWKDYFTEGVVNRVKRFIGNDLVFMGYEKDFNWGA